MSLAIVEMRRRLPYAPGDLCALVVDVKSYPRFIPWLKRLDVLSQCQDGETRVLVARAEVGWSAISERFTTEVRAAPGKVDVALVNGPFRKLENHWRFKEAPGGTEIDFYVAFEFRNPLLQAVAMLNREHAAASTIPSTMRRRWGLAELCLAAADPECFQRVFGVRAAPKGFCAIHVAEVYIDFRSFARCRPSNSPLVPQSTSL